MIAVVALAIAAGVAAGVWIMRKPSGSETPAQTAVAPAPSPAPAITPSTSAAGPAPASSAGSTRAPTKAQSDPPIPTAQKPPAKKAETPAKAAGAPGASALVAAKPAPAVPTAAAPNPGAVNDITVYCKHDFEQATLVLLEGSKMVYQARLIGKKKKGFIGIGGKGFGGELTESATIPAQAKELTVRVYSDDGAVNLQNKVSAHPPASDSTTLRVTPAKDQLKLEWAKNKK